MGQGGIVLEDGDDVGLKEGVIICKLVGKGGKDVLEFPPVKVIPGTEEASAKETFFGNCFSE